MVATMDYTADLDSEGRLTLRGDALAARYRVRHRADGVIELQPEGDGSMSTRALRTIERSVEALGRGEASAPVDLDEAFPNAGGGPEPNARAAAVAEFAAEVEGLRTEAGHTPEELLESLRDERERATRERYGDAFVDGLTVPRPEA